jgi:hypothetical protein
VKHTTLVLTLGALVASTSNAAPVEVFGGEFAIGDGSSGFNIDLNTDGVFDLNFAYFGVSVNSIFGWDGVVRSPGGAADTKFAAFLDGNKFFVHPRLEAGDPIGPLLINDSSFGAIAYESFFDGFDGGPWLDQERGYVGFSFTADDGKAVHYGWAEVEMDNFDNTDDGFLVLYRIGYETDPGVEIAAGAPMGCNEADFAEPFGELNFFDVSAFLTAYNAMDPAADFNDDGEWNFFDVSAFLSAYNAGCP